MWDVGLEKCWGWLKKLMWEVERMWGKWVELVDGRWMGVVGCDGMKIW